MSPESFRPTPRFTPSENPFEAEPIVFDVSDQIREILNTRDLRARFSLIRELKRKIHNKFAVITATLDYTNVKAAKWALEFLANNSIEGTWKFAIRATQAQMKEAADVFASGVDWIEVEENAFNTPERRFEYKTPAQNKEDGAHEPSSMHTIDLRVNGTLIGKAEMTYYSRPMPLYQINDIYVESAHQGKGHATAIMDQVEAFLRAKGRPGVLVDAISETDPAAGMYKRRGWEEVPGQDGLFVFNLPKNAKIEQFFGYVERQTAMEDRVGWAGRA